MSKAYPQRNTPSSPPQRGPVEKTMFRVVSPVKREGDEKTFWQRVGIAFENFDTNGQRTSISLRLNALPVNGELVLFPDDGTRGSSDDRE